MDGSEALPEIGDLHREIKGDHPDGVIEPDLPVLSHIDRTNHAERLVEPFMMAHKMPPECPCHHGEQHIVHRASG